MAIVSLGGFYDESLVVTVDDTKGAWVEITPSLANAINGLWVTPSNSSAGRKYLFDIGTGAAAAEVAIASNMMWASSTGGFNINLPSFLLPLAIPAGTRISARAQAQSQPATMGLKLHGIEGSGGGSSATTHGAVTASTDGTTIDPGGSANTKGSYVQLVASTSVTYDYLIVMISGRGNPGPAGALFAVDIALGAAASEVVLIPDLLVSSNAALDSFLPPVYGFPVPIPSGSRISARSASTTTDATDRLLDVVVIGLVDSQVVAGGGGEHSSVFG